MTDIHPLAGKNAPYDSLINVPRLISAYYTQRPEAGNPDQQVSFGTSGHRGCSLNYSFNETHILAISQAIADFRKQEGTTGPLFIGMDTHALSEPALYTAIEVLAANGVELMLQQDLGYTPTPVISHAILTWNNKHRTGLADGIVITPSHNPPADGGFKYNPPTGGPADTATTRWIQFRANELIQNGLTGIKRVSLKDALASPMTHAIDFIQPYVNDLENVVNMEAISGSGIQLGVDPMGGSGLKFWQPIAEKYKLNLTVVNARIDPTFAFMTLDHDGKIRMDCSSPYAMASLVSMKDTFDLAFGNDTDFDRHGIVTRSTGLMNPNHYLAAAINYLFTHRPVWAQKIAIGKTLVSSSMIDKVAEAAGRTLCEVPVGFKWFVDGLASGEFGFGGEESAGASFLRIDGSTWTTDKDGFILDLLAAEMLAVTGEDPGKSYEALEEQFGHFFYARKDAPINNQGKKVLGNLSPDMVKSKELAGAKIQKIMNKAPYNQAAIGGIKVVTDTGWFAARPSGTEDVYKIYAESLVSHEHLSRIQYEAQQIVDEALSSYVE